LPGKPTGQLITCGDRLEPKLSSHGDRSQRTRGRSPQLPGAAIAPAIRFSVVHQPARMLNPSAYRREDSSDRDLGGQDPPRRPRLGTTTLRELIRTPAIRFAAANGTSMGKADRQRRRRDWNRRKRIAATIEKQRRHDCNRHVRANHGDRGRRCDRMEKRRRPVNGVRNSPTHRDPLSFLST